MDAEMFYQVLVGEIAARSGDPASGSALLMEAARRAKEDPVYERAMQLAWASRSGEVALQTAKNWLQAEPNSMPAARALLQTWLNLQKVPESQDALRIYLNNTPAADRGAAIDGVVDAYLRMPDKAATLKVLDQVLTRYTKSTPGSPQATNAAASAWAALGRAQWHNDDRNTALASLQQAQRLMPGKLSVVGTGLDMMERGVGGAEDLVKQFLVSQDNPNVRMAYARVLTNQDRIADAIEQLQGITKSQTDHAEAWLLQGSLLLQDKRVLEAEAAFMQFLALIEQPTTVIRGERPGDRTRMLAQAHISLAQITAGRGDADKARGWLSKVDTKQLTGQPHLLLRVAQVQTQLGQYAEAVGTLRALPEDDPTQQRIKALSITQLQREQKRLPDAYDTLNAALKAQPDDADLLYEAGMVAELLGKHADMEQRLRRVIELKPKHHSAYNALGYSLVDRNVRVAEGKSLILKALESAPNDPYIRDSLGWAEFRLGNLTEARRILKGAFDDKPDAEIAAHLGEVLWALNERDLARDIWRQGKKLSSDNATLQSTLKRLGAEL